MPLRLQPDGLQADMTAPNSLCAVAINTKHPIYVQVLCKMLGCWAAG